jgi:hypothetical protein
MSVLALLTVARTGSNLESLCIHHSEGSERQAARPVRNNIKIRSVARAPISERAQHLSIARSAKPIVTSSNDSKNTMSGRSAISPIEFAGLA